MTAAVRTDKATNMAMKKIYSSLVKLKLAGLLARLNSRVNFSRPTSRSESFEPESSSSGKPKSMRLSLFQVRSSCSNRELSVSGKTTVVLVRLTPASA